MWQTFIILINRFWYDFFNYIFMKNFFVSFFGALLLLFLVSSCKEAIDSNVAAEAEAFGEMLPTADNSKTSLDWNGVYKGVLPCADCDGIETTLTLNADETYVITTLYIGKSDSVYNVSGTFTWDETGNKIKLSGVTSAPGEYQVGEGRLFQLDMDGQRISGDLADLYILAKQ